MKRYHVTRRGQHLHRHRLPATVVWWRWFNRVFTKTEMVRMLYEVFYA